MPQPRSSKPESACDWVNILVHGLFFMDFHGDKLILSTPDVMGHMVMGGCKGLLSELPPNIDWYSMYRPLKKGQTTSFTQWPQIMQFSKVTVGQLIGPYKCRIVLPLPETVVPLRKGSLSDFKYQNAGSGGVGDQIYDNCRRNGANDELALITCLRYQRNAPPTGQTLTYSFYAEHINPSPQDTNDALMSSQALFERGSAFNLKMDEDASAPTVNAQDEPQYGINAEDEYTLLEGQVGQPQTRGPNVLNCMQFGLS